MNIGNNPIPSEENGVQEKQSKMAVDAIDCHAIDGIATEADTLSAASDVPEWLNNDFHEKYLQNFYDNKAIRVIESTANLATAKGDNYASCIYRVKVTFSGCNHKDSVRTCTCCYRLLEMKE